MERAWYQIITDFLKTIVANILWWQKAETKRRKKLAGFHPPAG
jgi:hypothetical protein